MEIANIVELLGQGGITLVVVVILIKAVGKLYADMREDSKERENRLMEHLERQGDINEKVSATLDRIDDRLCSLEEHYSKMKRGE